MRYAIPFAAVMLTLFAAAGCGSESSEGAGGSGATTGSSGVGGSANPCEGLACGDPCVACPEGESCMPQACDAEGACVEEALAICGICPTAAPNDGDACPKVGLVCETEAGVIIVCRARVQCTDMGWKNFAPGCSSEPTEDPSCPAAEPKGTCDPAADAPLCVFGETLCGCPACQSDPCNEPINWACAAPPDAPCPPTAPKLGSPCSQESLACVYGACDLGGTSGGRTCDGGIWTEDIVNCSP